VTVADVPFNYVGALENGVEESSVAAARTYVSNLVATRQQQLNPGGTTPTTTPTTPTPTTVPPTTTKAT
jgi:hypothetical protein